MTDTVHSLLAEAGAAADPTLRRLWLVAAIEKIVGVPVFLVGGAAVDLYVGGYRPTDVDIVGAIRRADREAMISEGFVPVGRHLRWVYPDGGSDDVEFPSSTLDGDFIEVALTDGVRVKVISLESLVVDRIHQATDGSPVTFDEAVRLVAAVAGDADWAAIASDLLSRPDAAFLGSAATARSLLARAGGEATAREFFPED